MVLPCSAFRLNRILSYLPLMDILLINPYSEESQGINETTVEVPVGILSLAAFLEEKKVQVGFLDANALRLPQYKVIETITRLKPKVVGISVNIFSFLQAIRYTEEIKKFSEDIVVIWGGPHSTIAYDQCFNRSKVDLVVIGEGELTLREVLKNIASGIGPENINGIAYRQKGGFQVNPLRERITDLDSLPFPAYHLLPDLKYYKTRARKKPFMGIITSRGCPFSCIYCSKDVFKNKITVRSPENIIREIDLLVNKYGIRQIDILDDNFTINRAHVEQLCDLIISRDYNICINLQSGIRSDRVDEKLFKKMKKAGVFKVAFGVETGNKKILQSVKKELDLDKVLESARLARKYGMVIVGFFMVGLPGDNEETLQETIDFAVRMNPHIANFMMTIPFYGTELYRIIKEKGRLLFDTKDGISYGFYATKAYYELEGLTEELMLKYYKKAYRQFYYRPLKVLDILFSIRSPGEIKWFMETAWTMLFKKN